MVEAYEEEELDGTGFGRNTVLSLEREKPMAPILCGRTEEGICLML